MSWSLDEEETKIPHNNSISDIPDGIDELLLEEELYSSKYENTSKIQKEDSLLIQKLFYSNKSKEHYVKEKLLQQDQEKKSALIEKLFYSKHDVEDGRKIIQKSSNEKCHHLAENAIMYKDKQISEYTEKVHVRHGRSTIAQYPETDQCRERKTNSFIQKLFYGKIDKHATTRVNEGLSQPEAESSGKDEEENLSLYEPLFYSQYAQDPNDKERHSYQTEIPKDHIHHNINKSSKPRNLFDETKDENMSTVGKKTGQSKTCKGKGYSVTKKVNGNSLLYYSQTDGGALTKDIDLESSEQKYKDKDLQSLDKEISDLKENLTKLASQKESDTNDDTYSNFIYTSDENLTSPSICTAAISACNTGSDFGSRHGVSTIPPAVTEASTSGSLSVPMSKKYPLRRTKSTGNITDISLMEVSCDQKIVSDSGMQLIPLLHAMKKRAKQTSEGMQKMEDNRLCLLKDKASKTASSQNNGTSMGENLQSDHSEYNHEKHPQWNGKCWSYAGNRLNEAEPILCDFCKYYRRRPILCDRCKYNRSRPRCPNCHELLDLPAETRARQIDIEKFQYKPRQSRIKFEFPPHQPIPTIPLSEHIHTYQNNTNKIKYAIPDRSKSQKQEAQSTPVQHSHRCLVYRYVETGIIESEYVDYECCEKSCSPPYRDQQVNEEDDGISNLPGSVKSVSQQDIPKANHSSSTSSKSSLQNCTSHGQSGYKKDSSFKKLTKAVFQSFLRVLIEPRLSQHTKSLGYNDFDSI